MRLILFLLLTGSIAYAADSSRIAESRSQPAIVQSLSTGIYRPATVTLERHRAKVRFNRGGQIVLDLTNPVTTESEEIMGVDQNHNYWAVYVDDALEPGPPASSNGALAKELLDLPQGGPEDLQALQDANAEKEELVNSMPFSGLRSASQLSAYTKSTRWLHAIRASWLERVRACRLLHAQ